MDSQAAVETIGALALKIYRKCRDCPDDELAAVAPSVRKTANVFEDLEDHLTSHPLSDQHKLKLDDILTAAKELLSRVQGLIREVSLLPLSSLPAWRQSNGAMIAQTKGDLEDLAIDSHRFYETLSKSSEGRISRALSSLLRDGDEKRLKLLRRSVYSNDPMAWGSVVNELESKGVDKNAAASHQAFVEIWVKKSLPALAESSDAQQGDAYSPSAPQDLVGVVVPEPVSESHVAGAHNAKNSKNDTASTTANRDHEDRVLRQNAPATDQVDESTPVNSTKEIVSGSQSTNPVKPVRHSDRTSPNIIDEPAASSIEVDNSVSSDHAGLNQSKKYFVAAQQPADPNGPFSGIVLAIPKQMPARDDESDSDDDLFGSTPVDRRGPSNALPGPDHMSPTSAFRASLPPKMESTVSGPLPTGLFEHDEIAAVPSHASSSSTTKDALTRASPVTPQSVSISDMDKQVVEILPPVPPKESISIRSGRNNRNQLGLMINPQSGPQSASSGPPSPMTEAEIDLKRNAEYIATSIIANKWAEAKSQIQQQINGVELGSFVVLDGAPVQPSIKFMTFLQGVCSSFHGDFVDAKIHFDEVLKDVYLRNYHLDAIEAAAAKWLGDTCMLLNQSMNAALAYSVCLGGIIASFGDQDKRATLLAEDIRLLNQFTGSLQILKNIGQGFAGMGFNKDPTSVFIKAPAAWKRTMVFNTLDYCYKVYNPPLTRPDSSRITKDSTFTVVPFHLMYPVASFSKFPFDHDPFFRAYDSISLLSALSKPKSSINIQQISTSSLGRSKSLFFKTNKGAQWLMENLRQALDSHAIEYKIFQNQFLLRLSQAYHHIAYYQCFSIRLRKLPFRNTYGLKMTKVLLSSRSFEEVSTSVVKALLVDSGNDMISLPPNPDSTRNGLMLRLASYLSECEKPDGKPAEQVLELHDNQRFEMPDTSAILPELQASSVPFELDATPSRKKWWKKEKRCETAMAPPNVVELPA